MNPMWHVEFYRDQEAFDNDRSESQSVRAKDIDEAEAEIKSRYPKAFIHLVIKDKYKPKR
jgi:hypothetical protein